MLAIYIGIYIIKKNIWLRRWMNFCVLPTFFFRVWHCTCFTKFDSTTSLLLDRRQLRFLTMKFKISFVKLTIYLFSLQQQKSRLLNINSPCRYLNKLLAISSSCYNLLISSELRMRFAFVINCWVITGGCVKTTGSEDLMTHHLPLRCTIVSSLSPFSLFVFNSSVIHDVTQK